MSGLMARAAPMISARRCLKNRRHIAGQGGKFNLLKTDWTKLVHHEKLRIGGKEPLRLEQEAFLKAVADKTSKPEVSAGEGLAAMQCAEMILDSSKKHNWDQ